MKSIVTASLTILSLAFILTRAADAQQLTMTPGVTGGIATSLPGSLLLTPPDVAPPFVHGSGFTPLAAETHLSYFDPNTQTQWSVAALSTAIIFAFGERFTLSTNKGFVDSVTVQINSISQTGDSVGVILWGDTLYNSTFHLINVLATPTPIYASAWIYPSQVTAPSVVTIHFNHVQVPKDFFVVILSPANQTTQSFTGFNVMGDRKPIVARSTANSRSGFLALNLSNGSTTTSLLDTVFSDNTGTPIYSDLYITAHVQEGGGGGGSVEACRLVHGRFLSGRVDTGVG